MTFAVFSVWPYALLLAYNEYVGACTLGGEGFLPSVFIGGPILGMATLLIWLLRPSAPLNENHRLVLMTGLGFAAIVCLPQFWSVTIQFHHPCGAVYDGFLAFLEVWDRWIPLANLVLIGITAFIGLGPYQRKVANLEGAPSG